MISYLKGEIKTIRNEYLILDVNDVGYKVENFAPYRLGLEGKQVELYIYTLSNDRNLRLFGFSSLNELDLFEKLLSVSGIGPKSAMLMISNFSVRQIKNAVAQGDDKALKVKGLGKKTIAKAIIELKGKLDEIAVKSTESEGSEEVGETEEKMESTENEAQSDLVSALESLGYNKRQYDKILDKIDKDLPFSKQIRESLKQLSRV
jgi:Holliday junction DNA helicase RuvA